jgi:transposase-like protein
MDEETRQRIDAFLARPGMNKTALASLAGVHPNTLHGLKRDDWKPNPRTIDAIMAVVDRHA